MENLKDTGLNLRQIKVSDYATLIENLNHNFSVLLSSPLFKGMPGAKGNDGSSTSGERGSRWMWAIWDDFKNAYGLSNQGQVTLNFINGQMSSDLQLLMDTLHTDSIISNDNIVLPNGQIIAFEVTTGLFKDSGTSFAQAQGITEQRVGQMINDAIAGINEGSVIYEVFKAYAKNFPDTSASSGNNNQINPDSTVDIGSPSSKVGYLLDRHKFISLATANMNSVQDSATFVFGAAEMYHELIQKTQNAVGQTTNEYTPGVNETTSLAVLQDNYKNGIIMGYKNAPTMRDFARIYRDENALHITSNYSTYENEFGEIIIRKDVIKLRTNDKLTNSRVEIDSNFQVVGKAQFMDDIKHVAFEVLRSQNKMNLGISQSDMPTGLTYLIDFKESPTFSTVKNQTFISTDATGKVKGSGYSVVQNILDTNNPVQHTHIPTAKAVLTALETINTSLVLSIATLKTTVDGVQAQVNDIKKDALHFRNQSTVPNDASSQGIYRISSANSPNQQAGYIVNLVDNSLSTKAQFAVTATDILFRAVTGSINNINWTKVANKHELDNAISILRNRLDGHDADISQMSGQIANNYNTLNQKIDTVNQNLVNKINQDIATTMSTLRSETVGAIKGISVSGGLVKTDVGNSINIAHPTINTSVTQKQNADRIITGITVNNGHVTNIDWVPFSATGELRYGMIIDLMAHYYTPDTPEWWKYNTGDTVFRDVYYNYFDKDGRGRSDAIVNTFTQHWDVGMTWGDRKTIRIDLSKFVLCDGRNATRNLTGIHTVGAGHSMGMDYATGKENDSFGGVTDTCVNTINNIYIPHKAWADSMYNLPMYGLAKKRLSTTELPPHNHGYSYETRENWFERSGGSSSVMYWANQRTVDTRTDIEGGGQAFSTTPISFAVWKIMYIGE